ncbi:decapping and exoribonuclease protein-like [Oppia nitens]|uniref:decapping and exoribonuclease protein-like n=1 Tax=Oppia nitens TaxID=1686743 RepID=UPI0023DB4598|nr:decapping and exoribonuclease protein-like [Oppia nitens]
MGSSQDDLLIETKQIISSLVIPHPNGVSLKTLCNEYLEMEGKDLPFKELGFSNLTNLLKSMPDVVRPSFEDNISIMLFPVVNESTEHIVDMVSNQSHRGLNKKLKRKGLKKVSQTTPQQNRLSYSPQTPSPSPSSLKRPLDPRQQRMDPRLAKRMNTSNNSDTNSPNKQQQPDNRPNNQNGSGDHNQRQQHKPQQQQQTPSRPYHEMSDFEVTSLVSAVRQKTTTTTIEVAKNGIDLKTWAEIFDVQTVADLKPFPLETNGMMVAKAILRQPLKIGEYSLKINSRDDVRLFMPDSSELKYLHIPPAITQINLDLNHGYDMVSDIHWGKPSNTKIDELLQWISRNRKKFMIAGEVASKQLHTDFVCYRGILAKIMTTPYEQQNRWVICATKYRGTIYLCQFHEEFPEPDDYYNKMSFGGFRFESYLTSYEAEYPPDPNDFDPDHHEYCAVMRTRLMADVDSHSLCFGAELDCVLPNVREHPGTLSNFIELKTTKIMSSENHYRNFLKHKLLKWWAQSYIVGVPTVYCGYKDNKNIVRNLEPLKIEEFPNLALEFWSANVCLNFLNKFLTHMKELVTIDDPNVVYRFAFQPQQDITCTRLVDPGEFQILPDWYIQEFAN